METLRAIVLDCEGITDIYERAFDGVTAQRRDQLLRFVKGQLVRPGNRTGSIVTLQIWNVNTNQLMSQRNWMIPAAYSH